MVISAINNVKIQLKLHDICKSEFISSKTFFSKLEEKNGFEKNT